MVARSAGCEQQALSTASLAASFNRDPHYVRLITDDATDFASKIRCSQKQSYSKLYSLTVPVSLRDYFCGCFWANTSVRPYRGAVYSFVFLCAPMCAPCSSVLLMFRALKLSHLMQQGGVACKARGIIPFSFTFVRTHLCVLFFSFINV